MKHEIVQFYIPLNRPIRIPQGGLWLKRNENVAWLSELLPKSVFHVPAEAVDDGRNLVLARWGHVIASRPLFDAQPFEMAIKMLGNDLKIDDPLKEKAFGRIPPPEAHPTLTDSVLIVATPLLPETNQPKDREISDAFDRCVESVRKFELAYAVEVNDLEYVPLTRNTAYSFVPYVLLDLDTNEWSAQGMFAVNDRFLQVSPGPEPITDEKVQALQGRFGRINRDDPWHIFVTLSRAARRSLSVEGDYASAVIQAFTAGESLLDTLLSSLAWEEISFWSDPQLDVETVVSWFEWPTTLKSRLDNQLSKMLKKWHMGDQQSAPYRWVNDDARLRNRIVHTGYEPTEREVQGFLSDLSMLEKYVKVTLLNDYNRVRYARTTFLLVGREGLQKRKLYKGNLKELDEQHMNDDWAGEFITFRSKIMRLTWGN